MTQDNDMEALRPCPFCSGAAEINQIGNEATKSRGFEVKCLTWGCSTKKRAMVIRQPIEKAREFVVAAWNCRLEEDHQRRCAVEWFDRFTATEQALSDLKREVLEKVGPFVKVQKMARGRLPKAFDDLSTLYDKLGSDVFPESPSGDVSTHAAGEGGEVPIGPRARPHLFVCKGCPAYETEDWREPSGDGETYDTGQYAWCNAAGNRSMGAYHYDHTPRPEWCPALAPSARGEL